jgi:hypothetical protein
MSDNSSPTTKKRKANDGQATVPDSSDGGGGFLSSWLSYFSGRRDEITQPSSLTCAGGENLTHKMDRMEKIMIRMEERQLANMSSLERRCEHLEAECSSLKAIVGSLKEIMSTLKLIL